ncbi:MAG: helix-turn-helix domain-containing protein [Alphaproteobacteria bacterium]|nr:helix-turn-helix domain-containing protein [Alphaproteobacteria bacterium]
MYKHDNKTEPYGYIKNLHLIEQVYFDTRLQEQTKLTLALLIRYADQNGVVEWFSVKETATRKDVTRRAIQRQIDKLIHFGYLKRIENKGKGWRNKYILLFDSHVTQLGDIPHVTPLGHTHETPLSHTPCDLIRSHNENSEIKKEKDAHPRDVFLDRVKKEIGNHAFQEIGNLSEEILIEQAKACWDTWDAKAQFPEGSYISAFKGWLRHGLREKKIKDSTYASSDKNAAQKMLTKEPANPIQAWHKQIHPIVGEAIFKSWIRPLHWDGNGTIQAPTRFIADRVKQDYQKQINEVLPGAQILFKPYEKTSNQG